MKLSFLGGNFFSNGDGGKGNEDMDLIRLGDESSSKERLSELSPNLFGQLFMILQYSEPYPPLKPPFRGGGREGKGCF